MEEMYRTNKLFVAAEIILFNIVGNFGNINLIWSTIRKKEMRSNPGILLAITAASHTVCLLSEPVNVYFILRDRPVVRSECYPYLSIYMFTISQQAVMALAMAIDLFLAIVVPIKYQAMSSIKYITILCAPACIYGIFISVYGGTTTDDAEIPFCNPPLVLVPLISRIWSTSNVVINTATVLVYVVIIMLVSRKDTLPCTVQLRVIRRLKVIAIVFIFSWYIALLGVDLGYFMGLPADFQPFWQSNMVLFALLCYSQTFYVCLWRSSEYRQAFLEQMRFTRIFPAPKQQTSHVTANRLFTLRMV